MNLSKRSVSILFALIFFCVGWASPIMADCTTQADIPQIECEALVDLYNSTNGDSWTDNTNWNDDFPCSWYGVNCQGGHVVFLQLGSNNLIGTLPLSLGNLMFLRNLTLDHNQLSGSIPSELSNTNLFYLNLGANLLAGLIPSELGYLGNLGSMYLYTNRLIGPIPIEFRFLANLSALNLSNNNLTGYIPNELGELTNLSGLDLSGNNLTGTIPSELGNLTNLQNLALSSNLFSGSIPKEFGNLNNLIELDLSGNQLTGSIPEELGNLVNLQHYILLDSNQLTGSVPLSVAIVGAAVDVCDFSNNDSSLCMPATPAYQDIGLDPICGLPLDPSCKPPVYQFSWPIFMPAIIGGSCRIASYWGVYTSVCCQDSSLTFSVTISGETKKSTATSCAVAPTWEGWEKTTAGTKSVFWHVTSPTCGTYSGTFPWVMEKGKVYQFQLELVNGQLIIYVYSGDACNVVRNARVTKSQPLPEDTIGMETTSLQQVKKIRLDVPPDAVKANDLPTKSFQTIH